MKQKTLSCRSDFEFERPDFMVTQIFNSLRIDKKVTASKIFLANDLCNLDM